ncbi:MAG: ABC transporter substrate-binding protein/permease, partial [Acidobacteriota bacterium]
PFSFYGSDGELIGFDVDVARAIGERIGRPVRFVATEWDGILAGLLARKYDAIIGSMAITPERAAQVSFSDPYYVSGPQIFVHEEDADAIDGIQDLAGEPVGVGLGETYEHYLREEHPEVEVVTYRSTVDIFQDMLNERIDGFLTDRLVGLYQIEDGGLPFEPVGEPLYEERIGIPVRPGAGTLLTDINRALAAMKQDGELEELRNDWFGEESRRSPTSRGMTTGTIARKLLRGFGITLMVAAASVLIGGLAAIPFGVVLNQRGTLLYYPFRWFNDFIRATPVLIQLFFVYFGAPQVGLTLSPIQAAILTLSVSAAAYMAEVVRSGLMSVPEGQRLAARALGLTKLQTFRFVVWPQAFRIAIPPLMNSVVALTKDTALISVISVAEVIREAQSIISVTYDPMRYYFIAAAMFFVVTFPLMKLADRLERRIAARGYGG